MADTTEKTGPWRKSSFSGGVGECVEVRWSAGLVEVRDSKLGEASPVLRFTRVEFAAFVAGVKGGEFDLTTLRARSAGDGSDVDGHSRGSVVPYAAQESSPVSQ